jgi:hypothetical protein
MAEENNEEKPQGYKNAAEEIAAIELSIKRAQLEDIKLQKLEREYHMKELRATIGDREVKELQLKEDREAQGRTFAQQRQSDEQRQKVCTHKKGGVVSPRDMKVLSVGGNGQQFAVLKHQMINGDIWVRCLRCGETWCQPIKENFFFDERGRQAPFTGKQAGVFSKEKYDKACDKYRQAVQFETNNSMSGSVQCRFSKYNETTGEWVDATEEYRRQVRTTNLR